MRAARRCWHGSPLLPRPVATAPRPDAMGTNQGSGGTGVSHENLLARAHPAAVSQAYRPDLLPRNARHARFCIGRRFAEQNQGGLASASLLIYRTTADVNR